MTFLVVVESDAGGWRVDRDGLTQAICARWTEADIDSTHRSAVRNLMWEFETENGSGEAFLHEDGTCFYMDVRLEDAIWLAITFRRLTPPVLTWCSATRVTPSTSVSRQGRRRPNSWSWWQPPDGRGPSARSPWVPRAGESGKALALVWTEYGRVRKKSLLCPSRRHEISYVPYATLRIRCDGAHRQRWIFSLVHLRSPMPGSEQEATCIHGC